MEKSQIVWCDVLESTNQWMRDRLAHQGMPELSEGSVIVADFQLAGRGQMGNSWESAEGMNLLFSLLLRPQFLRANAQFVLSEAVSLTLYDLLSESLGVGVSIKWPNDLYYKDSKIAGILIEHDLMGSAISASIVGVGLNVNQEAFVSDAPNPTSMACVCGVAFDRSRLLDRFRVILSSYYETLRSGDRASIHRLYLQRLYRSDGFYAFRTVERGVFRAAIVDVLESGHLVLEDAEGVRTAYFFKEVSFCLVEGAIR